MAGRKNPFEDLEQMIERMSRQFEKSMGGMEMGTSATAARRWTWPTTATSSSSPRTCRATRSPTST
ncbi:hypothetical protein [Halorussus caseinilyticus]|uniref:Uncharacterized protein n=1 Tax=Halorussus caseinilyticus TaxID=3034025 RepID=A0ABD5WRL3_9EURY